MKLLKTLSVAGLSVAAASVFAGGIEQAPMNDLAGMYVGFGAGYNSLAHTFYPGTASALTSDSENVDGFAPFAQLGYWGHINQTWMWGVKGTYKYLNLHTGGLSVDAGTTQQATAQMLFGMNLSQALVYFGGGAAYMPTNFDDTVAGSHASMWGGIFSLGARKDLNPNWFVDANYSYAFSGKNTIASTTDQLRVQVQSFDVSMNYRFSM